MRPDQCLQLDATETRPSKVDENEADVGFKRPPNCRLRVGDRNQAKPAPVSGALYFWLGPSLALEQNGREASSGPDFAPNLPNFVRQARPPDASGKQPFGGRLRTPSTVSARKWFSFADRMLGRAYRPRACQRPNFRLGFSVHNLRHRSPSADSRAPAQRVLQRKLPGEGRNVSRFTISFYVEQYRTGEFLTTEAGRNRTVKGPLIFLRPAKSRRISTLEGSPHGSGKPQPRR